MTYGLGVNRFEAGDGWKLRLSSPGAQIEQPNQGLRSLVDSFSKLAAKEAEDHDYDPPTADAISAALKVIDRFEIVRVQNVITAAPTPEGGLVLTWAVASFDRWLEFDPDGQCWYTSLNRDSGKAHDLRCYDPNDPTDAHIFEK